MILLFILLLLPASWASQYRFLRVGELTIVFHQVGGYWVNKSCELDKCLALKQAKKFSQSDIPSDLLVGGKNPFAVRCKTVMKGKVIIALDRKGNEQSLCHFSDDSFLK
jgi:hypothetical protein